MVPSACETPRYMGTRVRDPGTERSTAPSLLPHSVPFLQAHGSADSESPVALTRCSPCFPLYAARGRVLFRALPVLVVLVPSTVAALLLVVGVRSPVSPARLIVLVIVPRVIPPSRLREEQ